MLKQFHIFIILLLLFLSGCDPFRSDSGGESHFDIIISGDLSLQFQGRATFGTFIDPVTGLQGTIIIMSADGENQKFVNFSGLTSTHLQESSYPIIEAKPGETFEPIAQNEFTATYQGSSVVPMDIFPSQIGQISFSRVGDNVLEGTFSFEAMNIIDNGDGNGGTSEIWITVEGQFTSVRGAVL